MVNVMTGLRVLSCEKVFSGLDQTVFLTGGVNFLLYLQIQQALDVTASALQALGIPPRHRAMQMMDPAFILLLTITIKRWFIGRTAPLRSPILTATTLQAVPSFLMERTPSDGSQSLP